MSIIEVSQLQKRYGERVAVADVSFEVAKGEIFEILGPNGAGKTTTVECIAGLRERDGGRISVLGLDPGREQGKLRELLGAATRLTLLCAEVARPHTAAPCKRRRLWHTAAGPPTPHVKQAREAGRR